MAQTISRTDQVAAFAASGPKVLKAQKVAFKDEVTLERLLDAALRSLLQHLAENQPAAAAGRDPEGLHQYRIALRRLRLLFGLIRRLGPSLQLDSFRNDARRLMSDLNEARDWDVFVTATLPRVSRACPSVDGFDDLAAAAQERQRKARFKARAALDDPRTGHFLEALGLWVEQQGWRQAIPPDRLGLLARPARSFAAETLHDYRRKALKRSRHFRRLSPRQRHRLRISLKKLRYAADFFLPLFAKDGKRRRYVKILAGLQNRFGHDNDMVVMERLVRSMTDAMTPATAHRAAGALLGWRAGRQDQDAADLAAAWKKFKNAAEP